MLRKDNGVHIESKREKDVPTHSNKPITSCEDSVSLGKEVFQAQGPFLCGRVGSEDCMLKNFPNEKEHFVRRLRTP